MWTACEYELFSIFFISKPSSNNNIVGGRENHFLHVIYDINALCLKLTPLDISL